MIYVFLFILGSVIFGLNYFFRKQQAKGASSAEVGVNATAGLLVVLGVVFVFFSSLLRGGGMDTLDSDIGNLLRVGTEAGEYLAEVSPQANILVVRYSVDPSGDQRHKAVWKQQQALVDGLQNAQGIGSVREIFINVPSPGAIEPNAGRSSAWFTRDELNTVVLQASKGDVVILTTGLPYGVSPKRAAQVKEGIRLMILTGNARELALGVRRGDLVGGILERGLGEANDGVRYELVTPQSITEAVGG